MYRCLGAQPYWSLLTVFRGNSYFKGIPKLLLSLMLETMGISAEWRLLHQCLPTQARVFGSTFTFQPKDQERVGDPLPAHRPSYP